MNRSLYAIRVGLRRGLSEFLHSLRSPQDQVFYLILSGAVLVYLWINRDVGIAGTDLLVPQYVLPGILGGMIAFTSIIGPAYVLAQEREDGTLLRMLALPRGILGYQAGQLLLHILNVVPMMLMILIPGALLFDGVMPATVRGWALVGVVLVLGLLATLPIGIVIGVLVPTAQKVTTLGLTPTMALAAVSGLVLPLQQLWGGVQVLAQAFPIYWIGHAMRAAFLPDPAQSIELTASWRFWETFSILGAWAILGALLTPLLLRRMSRRQSGSSLTAAREAAEHAGH